MDIQDKEPGDKKQRQFYDVKESENFMMVIHKCILGMSEA